MFSFGSPYFLTLFSLYLCPPIPNLIPNLMSSLHPLATMQDDSANLPASKTYSPEIQLAVISPISNPEVSLKDLEDSAIVLSSSLIDRIIGVMSLLQAYVPLRRLLISVFVGSIGIASIIPLLVMSFLVIRLLQFIRHGHDYYKVTKLKYLVRFLMYGLLMGLAFYFGFGFVIAELHSSKHAVILGHTKVRSSFFFCILGILFLNVFISGFIILVIPPFPLNHIESGINVREGILEIIDCIILWWMGKYVVIKYFPTLKNHESLGLHTWKWIEVSILILVGYNIITISTHTIVLWLQDFVRENLHPGTDTKSLRYKIVENSMHRPYLVYSAVGMKHSINFILNSMLLLLTWALYFGSHQNGTHQAKKVLSIGTWTCVSVLICSVVWLIKSCVLLSWEAVAVYNRLDSRILQGGKQLYFLGIIGRQSHDFFDLLYSEKVTRLNAESLKSSPLHPNYGKIEENNLKLPLTSFINGILNWDLNSNFKGFYQSTFYSKAVAEIFSNVDLLNNIMRVCDRRKSVGDEVDEWEKQGMNGLHDKDEDVKRGDEAAAYVYVKKLSKEVKKTAKADLLMQDDRTPTLHGVQLVAQYLLTAKNALSNDNYTSDILLDLQKRSQDGIIKKDTMKQIIESDTQPSSSALGNGSMEDEFDYFKGQLHDDTIDLSEEISLHVIKAWMDRACSNCLVLANTLSSAKEVVDGLDKIISFLLIVATFIMWLLLTGLASTKILLVTASPFLAATFIFGESCKTLFHGIMYIFVVHPFDVGDLCIIDQKMMEVRTIGFWKATFTIVGTQEEVMFTNSQLSNKDIVNHRSNFDWNDCIELDTTSLNKQKITKLKQKIEDHLEDETEKKFTADYNCIAVLTTEDKIKLAINLRHNVDCKNSIYSECLKKKLELRSELILHIHDLLEQIKNEKPKTSESSTEQAQENKELGSSS